MEAKERRHKTLETEAEILGYVCRYIASINSAFKIMEAYPAEDGREGVKLTQAVCLRHEYLTYINCLAYL
jgi:hypothetical protein